MTVNVSNPLGAKVLWALLPAESLNEQISGVAPSGTIGTTISLPEGIAYIPAASFTNWSTPNVAIDPHDNDVSIVWYGQIRTTGGPILAQYVGAGAGWYLRSEEWDSGSIHLRLYSYYAGGASSTFIAVADETVHQLGIRFKKSVGQIDVIFDGAVHTSGIAWEPVPIEDIGANAVFSMQNGSGGAYGCITLQCYGEALSDAEFATLANDPLQVFEAPPVDLTVLEVSQAASVASAAIQISGVIYTATLVQANSAFSGQITREQSLLASSVVQANLFASVSINPHSRMRALADNAPLHTWFKVNTTRYLDCQMPLADRPFNYPNDYDHVKVVLPWSSFAWDYDRARLLLFGGGHANYTGNQLYVWNGDTGAWEQACLPSALDLSEPSTMYVIDGKAPQSSHTYHNNLWLKANNMFATFGGAALPAGGAPRERNGGSPRNVAPWLYDLNKIDSEKVGGSDGSGMDTTRLGLNAWQHRRDNVPTGPHSTDTYPVDFIGHASNTSVAVTKDGIDYAIMLMDAGSGFPKWYRYQFGDVRNGENDTCTYIGGSYVPITEGWMAYDDKRDLAYRSSYRENLAYTQSELVARDPWAVGKSEIPIRVVDSVTGEFFQMQKFVGSGENPYGAAYDSREDCIWMWSGELPDTGAVYRINIPAYDPVTGWESTTWTVETITPVGARPRGQFDAPVLGKVKYIPEVGAFITLDNASANGIDDADVWMFKTTQLAPVALSVDSPVQVNSDSAEAIIVIHNITNSNFGQSNQSSIGSVTQKIDVIIGPLFQSNLLIADQILQGLVLGASPIIQINALSVNTIEQEMPATGDISLMIPPNTQTNILSSVVISANTGYYTADTIVQINQISSGLVIVGDLSQVTLQINKLKNYTAVYGLECNALDTKDPRETITIAFDYSAIGNILTDAEITIKIITGIDANHNIMLVDLPQITADGYILQRVMAGKSGCDYLFSCLVTVDGNRFLVEAALPVRATCFNH